jgi:endonuclease YncB( thermonuclease family)
VHKNIFFFVFFLAILGLALSAHAQQRTPTALRVVDGDTLKINYTGKEENLRLIGIDTPKAGSTAKPDN